MSDFKFIMDALVLNKKVYDLFSGESLETVTDEYLSEMANQARLLNEQSIDLLNGLKASFDLLHIMESNHDWFTHGEGIEKFIMSDIFMRQTEGKYADRLKKFMHGDKKSRFNKTKH